MKASPLLAFGVGCAKTGTNSLAGMFKKHYRSAHEPRAHALIDLILGERQMPRPQFREAVRTLLDPLDLEINVSQLNGHVIRTLVALYPRARFILTLRDPQSWVRSYANHQITRGNLAPGSPWARFRDLRFAGREPTDGNAIYPMERYLRYWLNHNAKIIRTVPPDRLIVVRTERLGAEIPRLAAFLDIPEATITHARENEGTYDGDDDAPFNEETLAGAARCCRLRLQRVTGLEL